jgi:hypothetical protein
MARKKVKFIATQYKKQEVKIDFYTKTGEKVPFRAVKKVPEKKKVEFYVKKKKP